MAKASSADLTQTADLLLRAKAGDAQALDELFRRHLPPLRRWARGRLPRWAHDARDTDNLIQEVLTDALRHLNDFEPRHEGAFLAYLRQALINRVRDEVSRASRVSLNKDDLQDKEPAQSSSPLELAIGKEAVERYESALRRLRPEEREIIIARVELQQSYAQVAATFGK